MVPIAIGMLENFYGHFICIFFIFFVGQVELVMIKFSLPGYF